MKRAVVLPAMLATLVLALAFWAFIPSGALAAVPKLINFQGILKDGSGNPVANASYSVTFTIYDAAAGGNNLWTETQSVTTSSGLFSVLLGAATPVPDSAFQDTTRYLGIKVGADPEMTPRQQLVSVAYGFRISSVDGASGGTITSKVSIGPGHTNTGADAFVAGNSNTASGGISSVGGGFSNTASGFGSTVGGGGNNIASDNSATVGGGSGNTSSGGTATVGGGGANTASNLFATVGGGASNAASGVVSTVGGGATNTASGFDATVSGGRNNLADDTASTVSGGRNNKARGRYSVVSGGGGNTAVQEATVAGGGGNTASGQQATVGGGGNNNASGFAATVIGGSSNIASGSQATVLGGELNVAAGDFSLAAGQRAKANHNGSFVWGDLTVADFASTAPNQFLIRASGGVGIGTNSPASMLQVVGGDIFVGTVNAPLGGEANLWVQNSAGDANNTFRLDGFGNDFFIVARSAPGALAGAGIVFRTGSAAAGESNRMAITPTGDVGIGTTTPSAKLDVAGSLEIGGGTPITKVFSITAVVDLLSAPAGGASFVSVPVPGAAVGDVVALGLPSVGLPPGTSYVAFVSVPNFVGILLSNSSSVSQDPPSATYRIMITQF